MAQPRRLHAAFTGVFTVARHLHRGCTADAIATCQGRKTRNSFTRRGNGVVLGGKVGSLKQKKKQNLHK